MGFLDQPLDNIPAADSFTVGSEGGEHTVGEHWLGDLLDVLQADHVAPLEGGPGFGSENEILDGAGAGAYIPGQ